jgi:hypothetical protein
VSEDGSELPLHDAHRCDVGADVKVRAARSIYALGRIGTCVEWVGASDAHRVVSA